MKKNPIPAFPLFLSIMALMATGAHAGPSGYKGYPRGNALISVQELKQRIDAP